MCQWLAAGHLAPYPSVRAAIFTEHDAGAEIAGLNLFIAFFTKHDCAPKKKKKPAIEAGYESSRQTM